MKKENKVFIEHINSFIIESTKKSKKYLEKELKKAKKVDTLGDMRAQLYIKAHKESFKRFTRSLLNGIENDVERHKDIYIGIDFNEIILMARNKLSDLYQASIIRFKDFEKKYTAVNTYYIHNLSPIVDEYQYEIEFKLKRIERQIFLTEQHQLPVDEISILKKSRETIKDWELIPKKDKEILTAQLDRFLNSKFTFDELISIYITAVPSLENILRYIAPKCGIKRKIATFENAIKTFKKYSYLSKKTINILQFVHKPMRDILAHGNDFSISALKCFCYSLFESIIYIRESIKETRGI